MTNTVTQQIVQNPPQPQKTGIATASMVLGIVAMCIGLIPILGIFALPCGIFAVISGSSASSAAKASPSPAWSPASSASSSPSAAW